MSLFEKEGYVCYVEKDENEHNEHFYERGNFIVCQKPKTKDEMDKVVTYSRVFMNNKYLQCMYNEKIMYILSNMMHNMKN